MSVLHISLIPDEIGGFRRLIPPETEPVSNLHITLSRPSTVPVYLETAVCAAVQSLCLNTSPVRLYLKPQIDAFITDSKSIHYGVPVDLDLSPQVPGCIKVINESLTTLGLRGFHDHPNPHITTAIAHDPAVALTRNSQASELSGPPGSQFFPCVFPLDDVLVDTPILCSTLQLKLGNTIYTFALA